MLVKIQYIECLGKYLCYYIDLDVYNEISFNVNIKYTYIYINILPGVYIVSPIVSILYIMCTYDLVIL